LKVEAIVQKHNKKAVQKEILYPKKCSKIENKTKLR
jgi:hypothetical protein